MEARDFQRFFLSPRGRRVTEARFGLTRMGPARVFGVCLALFGWVGVSHGVQPIELEVLGKIEVHSDVETMGDGKRLVHGRLSDEIGKPVAGRILVQTSSGTPEPATPCPSLSPDAGEELDAPAPGLIAVGASGEFCFLSSSPNPLVIVAEADHFMPVKHDVSLNASRKLSRPLFSQSPTTIDLFDNSTHVVEILMGDKEQVPERATLSLSLLCESQETLIDRIPLGKNRLTRFEWTDLETKAPGNCQFVAEASAAGHLSMRASRTVLVRDRIHLSESDLRTEGKRVEIRVTARGSENGVGEGELAEGLVEARLDGAFVALSPIERGEATIELAEEPSARVLELRFIPSGPALLSGDPLTVEVPAGNPGFRWASVHAIGLLCFAFWLGWAWLRPGSQKPMPGYEAPPREAIVRETGKRTGPIKGRVRDAHTGETLGEVLLTLEAVLPDGLSLLEQVTTDESGEFSFSTRLEDNPHMRIVAKNKSYMGLSAPTRSAEVTVHLTHRRRALVQNLLGWAKQVGPPWLRKPPPTPGSIERTALDFGQTATADWARAVSDAAYAPTAPSEETVVRLREPTRVPPPAGH